MVIGECHYHRGEDGGILKLLINEQTLSIIMGRRLALD
jgi:hypothetical protein